MNYENYNPFKLEEIEKVLKESKMQTEQEKNLVMNDLIALNKENEILNSNLLYFENLLKEIQKEEEEN
jgi:hypothetical protein